MARAFGKTVGKIVTGDKEINRRLQRLQLSVVEHNGIVRKAMNKALPIVVRSMRAHVPSQYKDAKRAIGSVNKLSRKRGVHESKAGAGVGKAYHAIPSGSRPKGRLGIGGRNLVWFILGTKERVRRHVGGMFSGSGNTGTGSMRPRMPDVIRAGANDAWPGFLQRMSAEVWAGIEAIARK